MLKQSLIKNINQIDQTITDSCEKSHRKKDDVTLVCVSKSVDNELTEQVVTLGVKHLAENRMENLLAKKEYLKNEAQLIWHFIGNLQRRKVKSVINEIDYFHALDSIKLAEEIQKRANKVIKCFVQVNVSGETSKQGVSPDELMGFVDALAKYDNIQVEGLMTMAPIHASEDAIATYFSDLKKLQVSVASRNIKNVPCHELSMGMSSDYSIAIECGATFVRVGSNFFN